MIGIEEGDILKEKRKLLFLLSFLLIITGCSQKQNTVNFPKEKKVTKLTVADVNKKKKRTDIINNLMIGRSKISFNNQELSQLSDGKFTSEELWGTFRDLDQPELTLQLNAADSKQAIYGEISGYELEGIDWDKETPVKYLGLMEEALQFSKDKKILMYKARTGDVIFSTTLVGKSELTDTEILLLKSIAKGIKLEFVGE